MTAYHCNSGLLQCKTRNLPSLVFSFNMPPRLERANRRAMFYNAKSGRMRENPLLPRAAMKYYVPIELVLLNALKPNGQNIPRPGNLSH
jgi:hypothetical protein